VDFKKLAERIVNEMCVPPLLHGDAEHQAWLIAELHKYEEMLALHLESIYLLGKSAGIRAVAE